MYKSLKKEFWVGIFFILGILSLLFVIMKVANLDRFKDNDTFVVQAQFKKIGGLKNRSAIKIGGVVIGRVSSIELNDKDLEPVVTIKILKKYENRIAKNSGLKIKTAGLLGDQYLELVPSPVFDLDEIDGDDENNTVNDSSAQKSLYLNNGDMIQDVTNPMDLEDLIGQVVSSLSGTSIPSKSSDK